MSCMPYRRLPVGKYTRLGEVGRVEHLDSNGEIVHCALKHDSEAAPSNAREASGGDGSHDESQG